MTKKQSTDEGPVEELFDGLGDEIPAPSDDALRAMARAAANEARSLPATSSRLRWPLRARWTSAVVAAGLLLASGLGFGLGNAVTPEGSAGTPFAGLGFLPAKGWTVMQSDTSAAPADAARAIAANVPFHREDTLASGANATLASLPPHGVLIYVTFTSRGDPTRDVRFGDVVELPLDVSTAQPVPHSRAARLLARQIAEHRLRTGVGGYNLDARIYYGSTPPEARMLRTAQNQLNRLVVASERVTLFARPTVLRGTSSALVFGSVDNGREGEIVTIQAKDCGQRYFTGVQSARTGAGGTWNLNFGRFITTTVRAVWKGAASASVRIRQVPEVYLAQRSARTFEVAISSKGQFWRKKVLFQRRAGRNWITVKQVVLTRSAGQPGVPYVLTSAEFNVSLPRGTAVRAVLPLAQAKPCYLGGVSDTLRTS